MATATTRCNVQLQPYSERPTGYYLNYSQGYSQSWQYLEQSLLTILRLRFVRKQIKATYHLFAYVLRTPGLTLAAKCSRAARKQAFWYHVVVLYYVVVDQDLAFTLRWK